MNDLRKQIEVEDAERKAAEQAEMDVAIACDPMLVVNLDREITALEEFNGTVELVRDICSVDRIEAIRRMIKAEELDPNDRTDVEEFLWQSGLNIEVINEIRSEIVNEPELKLEK